MTSHTGRLYALAVALVVFFLAWALVAAKPWQTASPDPRLQALAVRQAQLQRDAKLVRHLAAQRHGTASVRVVNLPPLTITRTS